MSMCYYMLRTRGFYDSSRLVRCHPGRTHVVLLLIALLAALTLQGAGLLQGALSAGKAKGAADALVQAVRYARQRAITDAQDYCVAFRITGGVGQYEIYTGARSGTSCAAPAWKAP